MARRVYDGFQDLLGWLEPSPREVAQRTSHKTTIEQAMRSEFPSFHSIQIIGSHTRGTAVRDWSDVDYFAKVGRDDVKWGENFVNSTTTLARAKSALQTRFPRTPIRTDTPGVVAEFRAGAGAVDVIPAFWTGTTEDKPHYPVFAIPDGAGGWMYTSPERHSKYIKDEDARAASQLAPTIRLLKCWKYARTPPVPVLGFHLEMLLASNGTCVGARSYQNILLDTFRLLVSRKGAGLRDPLGIAGVIPACRTDPQRSTLISHASYAAEKAERAINAELSGNIDDAFAYWNLVFNGNFPAY